jgi:hypothetical protein
MAKADHRPTGRPIVTLTALTGEMGSRSLVAMASSTIDQSGMVHPDGYPVVRAHVTSATLAAKMIFRCGCSVASLAIRQAGVIHLHRLETKGTVTTGAGRRICILMHVFVTGHTLVGCALVDAVAMAGPTIRLVMRTLQSEGMVL